MLLGNIPFYLDAGKDRVPSNNKSSTQQAFTECQPNKCKGRSELCDVEVSKTWSLWSRASKSSQPRAEESSVLDT